MANTMISTLMDKAIFNFEFLRQEEIWELQIVLIWCYGEILDYLELKIGIIAFVQINVGDLTMSKLGVDLE
jgi:hypothetical protein